MNIAMGKYTIDRKSSGSFVLPEEVLGFFDAEEEGEFRIKGFVYRERIELFPQDTPAEPGLPVFVPLTIQGGFLRIPDEWCQLISPGPFCILGQFNRWQLCSESAYEKKVARINEEFSKMRSSSEPSDPLQHFLDAQ